MIGDQAIIETAKFLRTKSREDDYLFKFGDHADEFGMILPGLSDIEAEMYKQRLIWDLSELKVEFIQGREKFEIPIWLHIGYSVNQYSKGVERVIEEANENMNLAKKCYYDMFGGR